MGWAIGAVLSTVYTAWMIRKLGARHTVAVTMATLAVAWYALPFSPVLAVAVALYGIGGSARGIAGVSGLNDSRLPVVIFPDGTRLECPTLRQILQKLGWFRDPSRSEYDVAIYGAGPAGLSAAVYAASEGLTTVVVERSVVGGQASSSSKIENYLGFPEGVSGVELAERARTQACRFGAELLVGRDACAVNSCRAKASATSRMGPKSSPNPRFAPRASITGDSICPMRTAFWGRVCTMVPEPAKPRCATATKTSSLWGAETQPDRQRCTSPVW
jgi:hypothetical protein